MPIDTPSRSRPQPRLYLTPPEYLPYAPFSPVTTSSSDSVPPSKYSPFRSVGLQRPRKCEEYSGLEYSSNSSETSQGDERTILHTRRVFQGKTFWLGIFVASLFCWWARGWWQEPDLSSIEISDVTKNNWARDMALSHDLQYYSAADPNIHYVGRWTATPSRLRMDGTFPGVYFEFHAANTTTVVLALRNAEQDSTMSQGTNHTIPESSPMPPKFGHVSFRPTVLMEQPAPPISLLACIDNEEYILLPNSSSLVSVRIGDLDRIRSHSIRIIAPLTSDSATSTLQLEGIWLSKSANLFGADGSNERLQSSFEDEHDFEGTSHMLGSDTRMILNGAEDDKDPRAGTGNQTANPSHARKKIVEVITDSPGSMSSRNRGTRTGGADGLLAGVMGWEYLLGEMFGVDHVGIGIDGMCMVQDCIGGFGSPSGLGDVFFRSGPYGSAYFERPWTFHDYVPDVLILNIGNSDDASLSAHRSQYEDNGVDFIDCFENTYVSFVKAIRNLAYPKHPAELYPSPSRHDMSSTPTSIPIFIMRPFRGQLEQATQNVVDNLRAEGDMSVFWLDTSGWLDENDDTMDFYLDDKVDPAKWRLTQQGNQRVAIFLHMHQCRYLASDVENCAFLPQEVYQGRFHSPQESNFYDHIEDEREEKLKQLFVPK